MQCIKKSIIVIAYNIIILIVLFAYADKVFKCIQR